MPQTNLAPPTNLQTANTAAEATLAFQHNQTGEPQFDPLVDAIQKEFGQQLSPSEPNLPMDQMVAQSLGLMDGEVFRCLNLTKAYGAGASYTEVIKGISFSVKKGEYVVIFGPSGSGKSTLLHMLSGLEPPTRGEIRIRNHAIHDFTDDEMAIYHREEVGLVFQNFNLLESLRVWENVAFPLMLAGAPRDWRRHESLKMLDRFGMVEYAQHLPAQLSGGQQQRVALARALIHDPDLLLIDEPTGNLDSKSATIVLEEIKRLHLQEKRTIILVTHSPEFLPSATRVFYIRDGNLLTSNEAESALETEKQTENSPNTAVLPAQNGPVLVPAEPVPAAAPVAATPAAPAAPAPATPVAAAPAPATGGQNA